MILLTKSNVLGCTCADSDIYRSYESALNIFKGEIISEGEVEIYDTIYVDRTNFELIHTGDWKYEVRILDVYKSDLNLDSTITIQTDQGSSCAFPLEVGSEYLIFTYMWNGILSTGYCTRTAKTSSKQAKNDLTHLEKFKSKINTGNYKQGSFISEDKATTFMFYGNGRLIYSHQKEGKIYKGKGEYIFKNGQLKIVFNQNINNRTWGNHMLYEEGHDSIKFEVGIKDVDENAIINGFEISLLNIDSTEIYHAIVDGNTAKFAIEKENKLSGMILSKTGYPRYFEDIPNWGKDYHEITLKWDKAFINLKGQDMKLEASFKNDNIILNGETYAFQQKPHD